MALVSLQSVLLCGAGLSILQNCAADPFLQKKAQANLLTDLESVLGHGSLEGRLDKLETRLQPMFLSLPKASGNLLAHATARYALHRISLDVHGWTIAGLEPGAINSTATSLVASGILRGLFPAHVEAIFQNHISADGFSMRDLSVLAATVEHFVHTQQKQTLRKACEMLNLPTMGPMDEADMRKIVQIYMAGFLQAVDVEKVTEQFLRAMTRAYPGWGQTVMLLDDEREIFAYNERDQANPFAGRTGSLEVALRVVEQISDQFAINQAEPECQEIKEDLLAYERGDTGRIRLVDFYRAGQTSRFFYTESKEYLRAMGALDDSDQVWGPKLIVSNYVLAKSNCLADSSIYSICCFNECEGLYSHLEQSIAAPEATSEHIAKLVARLSSSTVQAPRNLSQTALLPRLDEIATQHGGKVLLHSRLFSQWMHQAFPRECPYPHLAGTTTSLGPIEWEGQSGQSYKVSPKDLEDSKDAKGPDVSMENDVTDLMWTSEDEHLVEPRRSMAAGIWAAMSFWRVAFVGLCVALALTVKVLKEFGGESGSKGSARAEKYFV